MEKRASGKWRFGDPWRCTQCQDTAVVKKWQSGPVFSRLQTKLNEAAAARAAEDAAEAAAAAKAMSEGYMQEVSTTGSAIQ